MACANVKTCPYCAEQIQDDAIKCRFCGTMLVPQPSGGAAFPAGPQPDPSGARDEALQFSHSGQRYLLGYGIDFFGVWDRLRPGGPILRFPRTDDGWRRVWAAYVGMEPQYAEVAIGVGAGPVSDTPGWQQGGWNRPAPAARPVNGAWWLLPILLGWLGGLIAWLVNRDADEKTARSMLIVGIAISVVGALVFALAVPSFGGA